MPKQILDADPAAAAGLRACTASCSRARPATRFDPISPATIAADVTIGFVLQLDRAARMVAQHAVDPALPGLEEVIDRLIEGDVRRADGDAVRSGGPARRRARAGRSRDVAGRRRRPTAQVRAIASLQAAEARDALRAKSARKTDADIGAAHAARGRHQALPRAAARIRRRSCRTAPAPPGAPIGDSRPGLAEHARLVRVRRSGAVALAVLRAGLVVQARQSR